MARLAVAALMFRHSAALTRCRRDDALQQQPAHCNAVTASLFFIPAAATAPSCRNTTRCAPCGCAVDGENVTVITQQDNQLEILSEPNFG